MNEYARSVLRAANSMAGYPYKLGGRGGETNVPPYGIDCRGFAQRAYKLAGAWKLIGESQPNVRAMVKWALDNHRFRAPETVPGRAWVVFYCEATTKPEPGNPNHIRHVGLVKRPINSKWPKGLAISALSEDLDVRDHDLGLTEIYSKKGKDVIKVKRLKIFGYGEPAWASLDAVEVPITDPESPQGVNP